MKKILFLSLAYVLVGCVDATSSKSTFDPTTYERLTTGEKTLEKAFEAYDLLGGCEGSFCARFVQSNKPLSDKVRYIQLFDKDTKLSAKDKYCFAMDESCKYINNEDECILIRRELEDVVKAETVFNYKDYIPDNAKIGNCRHINQLKYAYKDSLQECDRRRENKWITESELQICRESAKSKLYEIATSGILAGEYYINDGMGSLEEVERRYKWYLESQEKEAKAKKVAAQKQAKYKKEHEECLKNANVCGETKTKGCRTTFVGEVLSVNNDGVLVSFTPCAWCDTFYHFIYTTKKYLSGQAIPSNNYYEYVGPYEYTNALSQRRRVNAYKETNLPKCK